MNSKIILKKIKILTINGFDEVIKLVGCLVQINSYWVLQIVAANRLPNNLKVLAKRENSRKGFHLQSTTRGYKVVLIFRVYSLLDFSRRLFISINLLRVH